MKGEALGRPFQILLVEDNPADARLLKETLNEMAVLVDLQVSTEGLSALEILHQRMQDHGNMMIDLIFLDLNLPGIPGLEILEKIKGNPQLMRIPVVMLTSSTSPEEIQEAYKLHANGYVKKPEELGQYMEVLKIVITYWISAMELPTMMTLGETSCTKVLLIEDNPGDARLIKEMLIENQESHPSFSLEIVGKLGEAILKLDQEKFDMALVDLSLPDSHGLEIIQKLRDHSGDLPIIVLTGLDDNEVAVQAVKKGAGDFLVKGQITSGALVRAIRHSIERHKVQSDLRDLAVLDELTGVYNRRGLLTFGRLQLKEVQKLDKQASLFFMDLDGLKKINDTGGHQEGDQSLVAMGEVLRKAFRDTDTIGRIGGDEFAVLTMGDPAHAELMKGRLSDQLAQCNARRNGRPPLAFSVGVVPVDPEHPTSFEELVEQADHAMYINKRKK